MNLTATAENGRARIELKGTISKWRETEAEFTSKVEQLIKIRGQGRAHLYQHSRWRMLRSQRDRERDQEVSRQNYG